MYKIQSRWKQILVVSMLKLDERFPTNQHDSHHDNWNLSDTVVNRLDPSASVRMNDCVVKRWMLLRRVM